ncbi:hypothetical protein D4764_01G0007550 [Takifugu flavidus]|uniref:HAT C-terminal dimerisation domain-containing protein n=1 Tax=Takifugu flavidus TaxID=433684 RepID=A0A5C6PRP7_9TELE|nr:hypothetical protein D4764_01G0007550 [Takifugu flavidus]
MKPRKTLPIWSIPSWIDLISVRIAFGLLSYCFAMEPTRKRSQVWDHFEMVPPNKCEVFALFPTYNNNTSSMMRHYRANMRMKLVVLLRKQELDEALVDFIVKDSQPFTVVSDPGFRALVAKLDPTCTLPSRQTVKAMVERRDVEEKEKAKAALQNVDSVSLTADMWTSINMDAYLAVTCHAIHAGELSTTLVGVRPFPLSHTAENIAGTARELLREWALEEKVRCLVTDAAANILRVQHAVCLAHALNLTVKKAMDATPGLDNMRSKTRRMITYFKSSSTTAKEKLQQIQDPLVYWTTNKALYPNLYHLANQYLATPASSVSCERGQEEDGQTGKEGQLCPGMSPGLGGGGGKRGMMAKLSSMLNNTSHPPTGHPGSTGQLLQ